MSALSDHRGIQQQDPAERLAAALRRIAVGVERREASAAEARQALEAAREAVRQPVLKTEMAPPAVIQDMPAVAASLDGLIARVRELLDKRDGE